MALNTLVKITYRHDRHEAKELAERKCDNWNCRSPLEPPYTVRFIQVSEPLFSNVWSVGQLEFRLCLSCWELVDTAEQHGIRILGEPVRE